MVARRAGRPGQERLVTQALGRALAIDHLRVSMVEGVPHIEGTVSSYSDKRLAMETTRALTGVRQVVNHLRVAPQASFSDAATAQAVLAALEADPLVATDDITLETREGVVELRGRVETLAARCSAESAACSVRGVDYVVNRLETRERAFVGQELERDLEEDLCRCLCLNAGALRVRFDTGVVHLSGTVPSPRHRQAAEEMVRWHSRVSDVVNSLAVEETSLTAQESNIMGREAHAS